MILPRHTTPPRDSLGWPEAKRSNIPTLPLVLRAAESLCIGNSWFSQRVDAGHLRVGKLRSWMKSPSTARSIEWLIFCSHQVAGTSCHLAPDMDP